LKTGLGEVEEDVEMKDEFGDLSEVFIIIFSCVCSTAEVIIFTTLSVEVIETSKNNAPYFLAVSSPSSTVTCLSP